MALEIERKFLTRGDGWRAGATPHEIRQGYLCTDVHRVVRVRLVDGRGILGIKSRLSDRSRRELEYDIPPDDARELLDQVCLRPLIEKTRWVLPVGAHTWEVDEMHGENEGLVVAEIELSHEEETFERPAWLGDEVTGDPRYLNANLAVRPFRAW